MQKKLIALAIAGLASSAAFAADNVTIYGRMDYGYVNQSGNGGGIQGVDSRNSLASGVQAGSRIGFRGTEDLGNGLKAIFESEFGTGIDQTAAGTTAATWLNRHSYVGLTGNFGTVVGGRLDGVRYGIFNKYDAFAGGTVGNFTQITNQVDRADNAVAYITPNFSGFTGTLAYATTIAGPELAGNHNDLRLNTIMGNYANGPIDLTVDYETVKSVSPTAGNPDYDVKVTTLGGSYDFGVVKVSALWDKHTADNRANSTTPIDYRDWFISAKAPIAGTKFAVKATYGQINDKTSRDQDATKFGLGLDYSLSKRTMVYVDYGHINNKNNATYQVSQAANTGAISLTPGAGAGVATTTGGNGVTGFDIGIAHSF